MNYTACFTDSRGCEEELMGVRNLSGRMERAGRDAPCFQPRIAARLANAQPGHPSLPAAALPADLQLPAVNRQDDQHRIPIRDCLSNMQVHPQLEH